MEEEVAFAIASVFICTGLLISQYLTDTFREYFA